MYNNKETYREALLKMQRIQVAGGWVRFGDIKKEFGLCGMSRKNLIPDLKELDLTDDEVFERLYKDQEDYMKQERKKNSAKSLSAYRKMKDRLDTLSDENERLRRELSALKSNQKNA